MATRTSQRIQTRKKAESQPAWQLIAAPRGGRTLAIRARLGLSRDVFARLLPISTRSLATIETGVEPSDAVRRRLTEVARVVDGLAQVVQVEAIGKWLTTPNDAFDGLKPLEVIERGEVDRIWHMIHLLESGQPV